MIPAIADASGDLSATWPWWVWAAGVATILGGWLFVLTRNPTPNLDPDEHDTVDVAPCAPRGGHFYRLDPTRTYYQCADPNCGHRVDRSGGEL